MREHLKIFAVVGAGALVAGCGAGSSLSTGSLFSGAQPQAAAAPKPVSPTDRAIYVASTAAKAQRCGYYFDPAQLKAHYIAAETQAGAQPGDVQKAVQAYDFTLAKVGGSIAKNDGYCTELVNGQVKAALNKQLAGDFNPPAQKAAAGGGWLDTLNQGTSRDQFSAQDVLDRSEGVIKPRGE